MIWTEESMVMGGEWSRPVEGVKTEGRLMERGARASRVMWLRQAPHTAPLRSSRDGSSVSNSL